MLTCPPVSPALQHPDPARWPGRGGLCVPERLLLGDRGPPLAPDRPVLDQQVSLSSIVPPLILMTCDVQCKLRAHGEDGHTGEGAAIR